MEDNVFFFFFFKRETAYEIKECDWSSVVCSSDLWGGMYDPSAPDKKIVLGYLQTIKSMLYIVPPPIEIEIKAYMPIPKSLSKKKQQELDGMLHIKKPDYDNIGKFMGDVLEDICYSSDSHIAISHIYKIYSQKPRVEIKIRHTG